MSLQVRYETFLTSVKDLPWRDCLDASVEDGVLAIKWDADNLEWVPLHVVRGLIQVRTKPTEPVADALDDALGELGPAAPSTPEGTPQ